MKVSTWLVIEARPKNHWSGEVIPVITKARRTRPVNNMAVKVTLDIEPEALQPHVEAMVKKGMIVLDIEEDTEQIVEEILSNPDPFVA